MSDTVTDVEDWPQVAQIPAGVAPTSPPAPGTAGHSAAQVAQNGPAGPGVARPAGGWPQVAQAGPPAPLPSADEPGRPAALVAGPGVEHERPPPPRTVLVCRAVECRADIRMALTEGKVKPMPVDADPHPDGNLVWRKVNGEWRMHVLRKTEQADPGERRFRSHWETCTSPEAFRRREAKTDPVGPAKAVFEAVGFTVEPVPPPPPARVRTPVRPPAAPGGDLVDLVTADPAPSLAQVGADQDEQARTCDQCGTVCPAAMPALWGAALVLLDAEAGLYDQLAVRVPSGWRVRDVRPHEEGLPYWNRRGTHRCVASAFRCQTPGHNERPARLFPGGAFCGTCAASRARR